MKKNLIVFMMLLTVFGTFSFAMTPALTQAAGSDEIGSLIKDQLEPVQDIYGQDEVNSKSLAETVSNMVKILLGFLGIIFLILIIYAGFTWMTAAGNDEKTKKAKDIIQASVIGVAIIIAAYAITYFVIDNLLKATNASGLS
ncbi:MAG: hypothetical protein WCX71_01845 [Candidatus Buchananbacteria bacterium]